jgi:hypothetical protein
MSFLTSSSLGEGIDPIAAAPERQIVQTEAVLDASVEELQNTQVKIAFISKQTKPILSVQIHTED